jgi:hypothetical protein
LEEEKENKLTENVIRTDERKVQHISPHRHRDHCRVLRGGSRRSEEQVENETKTQGRSGLDAEVERQEEVRTGVERREAREREQLRQRGGGQWDRGEDRRLRVKCVEERTQRKVL